MPLEWISTILHFKKMKKESVNKLTVQESLIKLVSDVPIVS